MCRAGCGNLRAPSGFGLTAEQDDGCVRFRYWSWHFRSRDLPLAVAFATLRSQFVMCRAGCGNLCAPSGFGLTAEQDDGWAWVSLPVVALSNWVSLTRCSLRYMTAVPCWPSGCLVPRSTCIRDPSDLRASPAVHVGCEPAFGSFGRRCRKLLRGRNSMMPPRPTG
jgi:hypothetical protein